MYYPLRTVESKYNPTQDVTPPDLCFAWESVKSCYALVRRGLGDGLGSHIWGSGQYGNRRRGIRRCKRRAEVCLFVRYNLFASNNA